MQDIILNIGETTLNTLVKKDTLSEDMKNYLLNSINEGKNILITGAASSGRTFFANTLLESTNIKYTFIDNIRSKEEFLEVKKRLDNNKKNLLVVTHGSTVSSAFSIGMLATIETINDIDESLRTMSKFDVVIVCSKINNKYVIKSIETPTKIIEKNMLKMNVIYSLELDDNYNIEYKKIETK